MSFHQNHTHLSSGKFKHSVFIKTLPAKIVIPVLFTIALFILTIFILVIPILEKKMMDGKREGILHLTESAWSNLNIFYSKYQKGDISENMAKDLAIKHLQQLRYGPELEDYFWINDMTPTIIMHPYRKDLVGKDVSAFKDASGKHMFVDMVEVVKKNKAGYVDYLWQWKDDSNTIVPKISYVKQFAPWDWIIGTGIYIEDIQFQIQQLTRRLIWAYSGILCLFVIISLYIIREGIQSHKDRIKAQEETALREKQLIQADKMASLGILVAGVAHEINNPVTSLMLNAPNLKKTWAVVTPFLDERFKDDPDQKLSNFPYKDLKKRIELILNGMGESAARIKRIIDELKDFSRPAGEGKDLNINQDVNLNRVIKKSLDLTKTIINKSTNHLDVFLDENLPMIQGNEQKLQQVIINLLVNAAQALEKKEQSIQIRTKLVNAESIAIEVKDTGPGISKENLKRITDPFFTTKRDDGGTGLGLSISEKIISEHHGQLVLSSKQGEGLNAKILLPIKKIGSSKSI